MGGVWRALEAMGFGEEEKEKERGTGYWRRIGREKSVFLQHHNNNIRWTDTFYDGI